MFLFLVVKLLL